MPQQNYLDELTPAFTPLLAIKEASRCLLCHDAPVVRIARRKPTREIYSLHLFP
jgi:NADPH-dependent glutamate synthase beta subunit-like oxidoreductase